MINFFKICVKKILRIDYHRMVKYNSIHLPKKSKIKVEIHGKGNVVSISNKTLIMKGVIKIFGNNCKLMINESNFLAKASFWLQDDNSSIKIGCNNNFCGDVDISVIEGKTIDIKDDCLISRNVSIVNGDSHKILDSEGCRLNESTNIIIGNHVWIGKNVNILKKGSLGDNCVVGANSLVTKDFSDIHNCVIAGVPAMVVKNNISWTV